MAAGSSGSDGRTKERSWRRAPRLATALEASLSGRSTRSVTVVDLSLTGCLVRGDALLDHGAILDLRLRLGSDPFEVKVRVTESYVEGASLSAETPAYLAGLQFLSLPVTDEARLRRFLEAERRRGAHATTS